MDEQKTNAGGVMQSPQNATPQPNMTPVGGGMNGGEGKSFGPIIGIIIIVIILIFGGLYFWGQQLNEEVSIESLAPSADETIGTLEMQSTSDEISDIESDLDLTDLEDLDADLDSIEDELGF